MQITPTPHSVFTTLDHILFYPIFATFLDTNNSVL